MVVTEVNVPLCGLFKCNTPTSPSFKLLHKAGQDWGLFRNRGHGPGEGQWGSREGRTWLGKSALAQERWPQARARLEGLEAAATFSGTSTRVPGVF